MSASADRRRSKPRDPRATLEKLNRRDTHLLFVSLFVLLLLGVGLATAIPDIPGFPLLAELGGFLVIVATYVLIKHREIHRLRGEIIEERVQVGALQGRVREISSILKVTTRVSSIGSLDETLRLILSQATEVLGADHGYLLLRRGKDETLSYPHPSRVPDGEDDEAVWLDSSPEPIRALRDALIQTGESILVSDRGQLSRILNGSDGSGDPDFVLPQSIVAAPLRAFGKTFGVVAMFLTDPHTRRRFSKHDRNLLRILADNASCAMRNLALYEKVRTKNEKLRHAMEFQKRAQKKLLEAEKLSAMRELVSGVAHELNNPLTSILGYVQLLGRTELSKTAEKYSNVIFEETERCRDIVQDFLAFARKEEPDRTLVEINGVVKRVLSMRKRALSELEMEVRTELDAGEPRLIGDPHLLQQAILNIVKTIESATMDGDAEPRSLAISSTAEDGTVHVLLEARGSELSEEKLENLFDPFWMTDEGGKGPRLNLCVARAILHDHAGEVAIESGPGIGFRACVTLPAQTSTKGRAPVKRTGESSPPSRPASILDRLHALVVADDETLPLLNEVLDEEGILPEVIDDPRRCASHVTIRSYDLVIVDATRIDAELREQLAPLAAWCPHVILHGQSSTVSVHDFPSDDNHFHLLKPVEKSDFQQVLHRALRSTSSSLD